jgi:hypothetical protein
LFTDLQPDLGEGDKVTTTRSAQHLTADSSRSSLYQPGGYSDSEILPKLSDRKKVVCRIVLGRGGATGFLIGKDMVMTKGNPAGGHPR